MATVEPKRAPDRPPSSAPSKPKADKAEFKASEKKIELEKIPELESQKPKGKQPLKEGSEAQPKVPKLGMDALRPMLDMGFDRYNAWLEAPQIGDPKDRYRLSAKERDDLIKVLQALDEKYHFSSDWMQYFPEIMTVIVVGGIIGKLVFGARWKNSQERMAKTAAGVPANEPAPSPLQGIRDRLMPKPQSDVNKVDPELIKASTDYLKAQEKRVAGT